MTRKAKSLKDKNILYITHSYNNFVKFQVEILAREFKDVYVIVRHKPFDLLSKIIPLPQLKFYSSSYKIDLKNTPENVHVYKVILWYLPLTWFYRRLGKWQLNASRRLIRKKKLHFDIVHSHMTYTAGFAGLNIARENNVPFVVTGHGADIYSVPFKDPVRRKMIVRVLKEADSVITVSQFNRRMIEKLGVKRKVHVIPNGYDPKRFNGLSKNSVRKELHISKKEKVFLHIANLTTVKAHKLLFNAISKDIKAFRNCKVYCVGGGNLYTHLKIQIQKLKIGGIVKLLNHQSTLPVSKYLIASDYGILPSTAEGMPTVLFEYMAAGLPILATKVGGIPEVVNNKIGILIESGDEDAILEGLKDMLKLKLDRKRIVTESKKYTWENICSKVSLIYKDLLK